MKPVWQALGILWRIVEPDIGSMYLVHHLSNQRKRQRGYSSPKGQTAVGVLCVKLEPLSFPFDLVVKPTSQKAEPSITPPGSTKLLLTKKTYQRKKVTHRKICS